MEISQKSISLIKLLHFPTELCLIPYIGTISNYRLGRTELNVSKYFEISKEILYEVLPFAGSQEKQAGTCISCEET